ncbi:MAG: hypothetical protein ACR2P1_25450 [Pseudomonadales bacterium]
MLGALAYLFGDPNAAPGELTRLLRLLDVQAEQSVPTYFSVLNLLFSAILILVIYKNIRLMGQAGAAYWLLLALIFLGLSFDESASLHEKLGKLQEILVQRDIMPPILETHRWLPFGVAFVIAVGVVFFPFLRNLPRDTLAYFLFSGFIFITGAIGFEFLGAVMLKTGFVSSKSEPIYLLRRIFEEGFEMYGIACFNCALYREISIRQIVLEIRSDSEIRRQ